MEDTSLQLTVDLGQQILSKLSHLNSHQITVNWDLGPNVTRAVKYLAAALVICKTIEVRSESCIRDNKRVTATEEPLA